MESSGHPPAPVALRAIGTPGAAVGGAASRLHLKRGWALLAYLSWHRTPVPRGHLASLLWPDADESTGRTRLRRLMHTTAEVLGAEVFSAEADAVSMQGHGVTVDALDFARVARQWVAEATLDDGALAMAQDWAERAQGALLQGVSFGSDPFDDWVRAIQIEHDHLLSRLLERLVKEHARRDSTDAALQCAEALVRLDPYREPSHALLMQLQAQRGHRAGVEAAYTRCAELLRSEFGIRPGPAFEAEYLRLSGELQQRSQAGGPPFAIRYADTPRGAVAYTQFGTGPGAMVVAPGFVCHIEIALENPRLRELLLRLARRIRVIFFDRRGVGLSERLSATGTPAAMAGDMLAILDHAGIAQAWLFGASEGALGAMQLAIDRPERVQGLCLFGALARGSAATDYPWAMPAAAYDVWLQRLVAGWGGPVGVETFAPGEQHDPVFRAWWARLVRHAASPGGMQAILGGLRDADIRADLDRIRAPTLVMHRRGDRAVRYGAGEHLANHIPGAALCPLEGVDHFWWCGDGEAVVVAIEDFMDRH